MMAMMMWDLVPTSTRGRAITNLGFSATHARQAMNLARAHVGVDPTIQDLVREALRARRACSVRSLS